MEQIKRDMPASPYVGAGVKKASWHPDKIFYKKQAVISAIVTVTGVPWEALVHRNRGKAEVVVVRNMAFYYLHVFSNMSLEQVGEYLNRHYTSVLHGKKMLLSDLDEGKGLEVVKNISAELDRIQSSKQSSPHDKDQT